MQIGEVVLPQGDRVLVIEYFLDLHSSLGRQRNKQLSHDHLLNQNIEPWRQLRVSSLGWDTFSKIYKSDSWVLPSFIVITKQHCTLLQIQCFMNEQSISRWIAMWLGKEFKLGTLLLPLLPHKHKLLIFSLSPLERRYFIHIFASWAS